MREYKLIVASIATITATAKTLQEDIHKLAVECLMHAEEHGDITLVDKLVKSLESQAKGQRVEALKFWVESFSPIRWNNKTNEAGVLEKSAKKYVPYNVDTAKDVAYYDLSKEQKVVELTFEKLEKQLLGMLKKIERAENGEGNAVIPEGEDVTKMKTLARRVAMAANNVKYSEAGENVGQASEPQSETEEPELDNQEDAA